MKPTTCAVMAVGFAALILTMGCGKSLQQKIEEAKGNAAEEQQAVDKSVHDAQADYLDEWQDFRAEAEKQLAANTATMSGLKTKAAAISDEKLRNGANASLEELSRKSKDLTDKLKGYKDEGKVNWDAFKRDFSQDLAGVSKSLKDMDAATK
jgi:hypothetical protein